MDDRDLRELANRVIARDRRAIARAISRVEARLPAAAALVSELGAHGSMGYRIGITGPPGAGKSTLVNRLVSAFRRQGKSVAVLAVDPSSPYTGGALLGDRLRMQEHAADPEVFIRSMATRGHLGGLAVATAEAAVVLEAAGFEIVLIETVGVGQHEIDIVGTADVCVVTLVPGAGDEVQALKAGLMEIADVFAINKADLPGADATAGAVEAVLGLAADEGARRPLVLRVSAATGDGVPALVAALEQLRPPRSAPRPPPGRRPRPTRGPEGPGLEIDHVAIATNNLAETAAVWRALFDLREAEIEDVFSQQVRVQFLGTGAGRLELIEPAGPDSAVARFLERRGPGLHHVALRVRDVAAALATLRARGVRLIDEQPRPGAEGRSVAFVHPSSTGGVLVELIAREDTADADR